MRLVAVDILTGQLDEGLCPHPWKSFVVAPAQAWCAAVWLVIEQMD